MTGILKCRLSRLTTGVSAALVAALLSGACADFDIPNLNQPAVEDLSSNPSTSAVVQAAVGLLGNTRLAAADNARTFGHWGREGYSLNVPQGGIGSIIAGPFAPGSTRGEWSDPYRNLRTANVLLDALDVVEGFSSEEIEAVRGFTKTIMAYDFMHLITHKQGFGVPIDVKRDPTGDPAAPVSTSAVWAHMITLLDEGMTSLQAAGTAAFPMPLPSGLADFNTPASFIGLNRAIKARTQVYSDDFAGALISLGQSFLDTAQPLSFGAYHNFASATGDEVNRLFAPQFHYADITFRDAAQLQADGVTRDQRSIDKTKGRTLLTLSGVSSDLEFTMYTGTGTPIPWIKNEELILLRAEANLAGGAGLGAGALDAALADINFVRQNAGNLPAITSAAWAALTDKERIQELLYNKRFSLPWEYGHSWIDHRHYHVAPWNHGTLADLPNQSPGPPDFHNQFLNAPFPSAECEAQTTAPAGCTTVNGIF